MTTKTTEALIARRVRQGGNEDQSRELLAELVATCGAGTLACALHYNGFATERGADAAAAELVR